MGALQVTHILSPETLSAFLIFAVPGIIALYFRGQFLNGRIPPISEGILAYITVSLIYHAVAYPLASGLYASPDQIGAHWREWVLLLFIAPAAIGILLGLNIRKGWIKKLVNAFGVSTIHPIASAWDWRFSHCEECWVIVVLKDSTKWYGFIGGQSFMSSDTAERDLYVEQVYEFQRVGKPWRPRHTSVWISHGEIQSIEFLKKQ